MAQTSTEGGVGTLPMVAVGVAMVGATGQVHQAIMNRSMTVAMAQGHLHEVLHTMALLTDTVTDRYDGHAICFDSWIMRSSWFKFKV